MKVTIPKKEDVAPVEEDSLPEEERDAAIEPTKSERERELELELAEKRGELKALKGRANPDGQMTLEQTKQLVYSDINNLSDEDFQKKYKSSKHAASMTVMDADNRQTKAEAKRDRAEASALTEVSAKFGSDFYKFKNRILEDVADLSEEARQDPEKLTRWIERQYLALSREEGKPVSKKADDRRRVVTDFEKPAVDHRSESRSDDEQNDEIKDEIPAESDISNQKLAHFMGIHSEKERKELAGKNLIYVDMDLGDGWHYGDPKRGYEKRERAKVA